MADCGLQGGIGQCNCQHEGKTFCDTPVIQGSRIEEIVNTPVQIANKGVTIYFIDMNKLAGICRNKDVEFDDMSTSTQNLRYESRDHQRKVCVCVFGGAGCFGVIIYSSLRDAIAVDVALDLGIRGGDE